MIAPLNATNRKSGWRALLIAGAVYAIAMAGYTAWRAERSTDFRDFWRTAQHFRNTGEITTEHGVHNYLPFFAVFMVPWTLLPLQIAMAGFTLFSMALLAATVWMIELLMRGRVGERPSQATLVTIGLMLPFMHSSVTVGAVNILLLFLVVASWLLVERGREWEAGLPLGLAVLIKLLPAVLIVFFLIKLRWRVSLAAILLASALGLGLPLLTMGLAKTIEYHEDFYHNALVEHSAHTTITAEKPRKAKYNNQSMPIVLRRLLSPIDANAGKPEDSFEVNAIDVPARGIWLTYAALMLGGLAVAVVPMVRRGGSWPPATSGDAEAVRAQFGAWCCLMLIASPLVWTHYFVLAFWPLAVVAYRAERVRRETKRVCKLSLALLVFWLAADILIAWPAARAIGVHMLATVILFATLAFFGGSRRCV